MVPQRRREERHRLGLRDQRPPSWAAGRLSAWAVWSWWIKDPEEERKGASRLPRTGRSAGPGKPLPAALGMKQKDLLSVPCCLARAWRCPAKKVGSLKEAKSPERGWHCLKNKKRYREMQSVGSAGGERVPLALAHEEAEEDLGGPISKTEQPFCSKMQRS